LSILLRGIAQTQLDRPVSLIDALPGFLNKLIWWLITEGDASGISRNGFSRTPEEFVERNLQGLALNVPQCHVDAADGEAGAGAHAMACELIAVKLFPDRFCC
jgi:hypothetical protein